MKLDWIHKDQEETYIVFTVQHKQKIGQLKINDIQIEEERKTNLTDKKKKNEKLAKTEN
jgi:hypothetical protein